MFTELFRECAYEIKYETAGHGVSYAFRETNGCLFIFFQGSYELIDWFRNFDFISVKTVNPYGIFKVHRGFYEAYQEVRNIILDKAYEQEWRKIIVVGYSHGGALCQLAIQDLNYHFPNGNIFGFAYESPRCLKVKKQYRRYWNNLFNIRNGCDIVPHLPPRLFGYTDLGSIVKIKGDTKLVLNKVPCFIKYHYPQCVEDGLKKFEH